MPYDRPFSLLGVVQTRLVLIALFLFLFVKASARSQGELERIEESTYNTSYLFFLVSGTSLYLWLELQGKTFLGRTSTSTELLKVGWWSFISYALLN